MCPLPLSPYHVVGGLKSAEDFYLSDQLYYIQLHVFLGRTALTGTATHSAFILRLDKAVR